MDSGKFVTAGLVLRQTATKESDYILTVLTADGILSVIAKGARSRRSRYSAACQFLAYSELTVTRKGEGQIIQHAHDYIKPYRNNRLNKLISLLVIDKYFEKTGQK